MHEFYWPQGFKLDKHMTFMSLVNPEKGNVISGESSNVNFSRGGRQKAILLDEFAFWENDAAAWGATADTTNCRIVITTPSIIPNTKAKRLRFGTDGEQIKILELDYTLDPRKDAAWLAKERSRRSDEDFAREILRDWQGSVKGIVYPEISRAELGDFPYNPLFPLYTSWDFGLDGIAIGWWQRNLKNGKWRRIHSFFCSNKIIDYVFPCFGVKPDIDKFPYTTEELVLFLELSRLPRGTQVGDPDVNKRDLKTGISTRRYLEERLGLDVRSNSRANDWITRRSETKRLLQDGIEINDTPQNRYYLECMRNARYPQRTETSQSITPISLPIHDWTSHHRTDTEYLAVNVSDTLPAEGKVSSNMEKVLVQSVPSDRPQYDTQEALGKVMQPQVSPWT
jgi:hypothetical protein